MISKEEIEGSVRGKRAKELFLSGYNCSQSVFLAFKDLYDLDEKTALMISSSFGGGMGRLREVCGALSGAFLLAGILFGYSENDNYKEKSKHYKRIQEIACEFKELNGSIICRELLGLSDGSSNYKPSKRTKEYYKKRPCADMCMCSAAIMEKYIRDIKEQEKL